MTDDPGRPPGLLDVQAVAEMTGLAIASIHMYTSNKRMPAPDYRIGGVPVWKVSTISRWDARRAKR